MLKQCNTRLDDFDPVCSDHLHCDLMGKSYYFTLRDNLVEAFKRAIIECDGKKMWKTFTCLKSELVNHWLPHFEYTSGDDVDDAVERVRMHAWAYRANKSIKTNNRKAELEGRAIEEEKVYTDAPVGTITNIPLELSILKKHHAHPFLKVNLRALEDGSDSEKEVDAHFVSVVSLLKKRRQ